MNPVSWASMLFPVLYLMDHSQDSHFNINFIQVVLFFLVIVILCVLPDDLEPVSDQIGGLIGLCLIVKLQLLQCCSGIMMIVTKKMLHLRCFVAAILALFFVVS